MIIDGIRSSFEVLSKNFDETKNKFCALIKSPHPEKDLKMIQLCFSLLENDFNQFKNYQTQVKEIKAAEVCLIDLAEQLNDPEIPSEILKESLFCYAEKELKETGKAIDTYLNMNADWIRGMKENVMTLSELVKQQTLQKAKSTGTLGEPFFISYHDEIPKLNPSLGIYPIPTVGYYCDTYPTFDILMLVKKNGKNDQLIQHFPKDLQTLIAEQKPKHIDFYFIAAGTNRILKRIQADKKDYTVNLLCHAWKFPHVQQNQTFSAKVEMGIYTEGCEGITPAVHGFPLALNKLSLQDVVPHPATTHAMCCSPNNAHFLMDPEHFLMNDFWAVAKEDDRLVITYHWLIHDDRLNDILRDWLVPAQNLLQTQQTLESLNPYISAPLLLKWSNLIEA